MKKKNKKNLWTANQIETFNILKRVARKVHKKTPDALWPNKVNGV